MTIQDVLVLQWTFSPPDYFEAPVAISRDDYEITVQDGKVEARMEPGVYEGNLAVKDVIEDALNNRFLGVQLLSHRPYKLSYAGGFRVYPDGHRELFIMPGAATVSARMYPPDIVITDTGGNIIYNSRKERIEKKTELAYLAEKHGARDCLAKSLLASYHAAVRDPDNELVHLYEIREALAERFDGEKQVVSTLGISRVKWRALGRLADNQPIKQGRHRGKFTGVLRDATEAELKEAREIALNLILAYLRYLDAHFS